jgi:hypothetical protein
MELARRSFLTGLVALVASPAIVRVENIMPVRDIARLYRPSFTFDSFDKFVPNEWSYQWVANTVMGQPTGMLDQMLAAGWRIVPAARHKKQFVISGERIEHGGCILMDKPKQAVQDVRSAEISKARNLLGTWEENLRRDGIEVSVRETPTVDRFYTLNWRDRT